MAMILIQCQLMAQTDLKLIDIDSLIHAYSYEKKPTSQLILLQEIVYESNSTDTIAIYAEEYYLLSKKFNDLEHQGHALSSIGANYHVLGVYDSALFYAFKSLDIANKTSNDAVLYNANLTIANSYLSLENYSQAILYFNNTLEVSRQQSLNGSLEGKMDKLDTAIVYNNLGELYNYQGNFDSALYCYNVAIKDFQRMDYSLGLAYAIGNIGTVYAQQNKHDLAHEYIDSAVHILEGLEDMYPIAVYLTYMSDIYQAAGDDKRALAYLEESLAIANAHELREQQRDAHEVISEFYATRKNYDSAFRHQALYYAFKDSVENLTSVKNIAEMRADYEVSQKQVEVDLLNQKAKTQRLLASMLALGIFFALAATFFLYRRNKERKATNLKITKQNEALEEAYGQIQVEQEKSEELLLNILPEATATELKEKGQATPRHYEMASILFTDFKGFTQLAEKITPQEVVDELNYCYGRFDEICVEHNIEKIKTIGDAYMCVGGIPAANTSNPIDIVNCALAMMEFMEEWKANKRAEGLPVWDLRLGIHTGEIIAGVVGKKKFAYDIWGDSVNLASRMESSGEPGKINISGNTYELIKSEFDCEYRGKIPAKNKGEVDMYFVIGKREG